MDLSKEIESAIKAEVKEEFTKIGEWFVQAAVEGGTYRDRTGRLRRSNKFEVNEDGLTLMNDCPYATKVEAFGYEVFSTFAREAYEKLNK